MCAVTTASGVAPGALRSRVRTDVMFTPPRGQGGWRYSPRMALDVDYPHGELRSLRGDLVSVPAVARLVHQRHGHRGDVDDRAGAVLGLGPDAQAPMMPQPTTRSNRQVCGSLRSCTAPRGPPDFSIPQGGPVTFDSPHGGGICLLQ